MKFLLPFLLIASASIVRAQDHSEIPDITGEWSFEEIIPDTNTCEAPTEFPIKEFQFFDDKFTFISFAGDTATGNYEIMDDFILRFHNAVVNGVSKDRDERCELVSVNHSYLILLFPWECGSLKVVYRRED